MKVTKSVRKLLKQLLKFTASNSNGIKDNYVDSIDWSKVSIEAIDEWSRTNTETMVFNENSNVVCYENTNNVEYLKVFNKDCNLIHYEGPKDCEIFKDIEYYPNGQVKLFNGLEIPYFEK